MSRKIPPPPVLPDDAAVIDSHCHLDMDDYRVDLSDVISRALRAGVKGIVSIGIDLSSSRSAIAIARANSSVRATVGIHPHDAATATDTTLNSLAELAANHPDEVVGFGEIGLDYVKKYCDRKTQLIAFRNQLRLARELKLPVIIHDREAHEDCLQLINEEGPFDQGGVMHCFSGDTEFARKIIDANFHVSIPGIVTFKKAETMQRVAAAIPDDRLLVETDGPFLSPVPYRGKRNEPLYTLYTLASIAGLRETTSAELARQTTANCCTLFGYSFNC
jgi:TatD DNase family protein